MYLVSLAVQSVSLTWPQLTPIGNMVQTHLYIIVDIKLN